MHSIELLRELYTHMQWADARIWSSVHSLPIEQAHEALHERLFHVHYTQHVFLQTWVGEPFEFVKSEAYPSLSDVEGLANAFYTKLSTHMEGIDSSALDAPMPLPWAKYMARQIGREVEITTLGETMFQVTSHSVHHRGQVNMQLRDLGGQPPLIDYIVWVWMGRPDPEWISV